MSTSSQEPASRRCRLPGRISRHALLLPLLALLAAAPAPGVPAGAAAPAVRPLAARLADMVELTRFVPERALPLLLQMEQEARSAEPAAKEEYLAQLCSAYFKLGKQEQAGAVCDELIETSRLSGDRKALAEGLLLKAYIEFALNNLAHSHQLIWDAERLAADLPDVGVRVRSLISAGQAHAEEGDFMAGEERLQAAAALARTQGTPTHVVMAQNALAVLYAQLREPDKGFEALRAAAPASERGTFPARAATLRLTEASLATDLGQYRRALAALQAALVLERSAGADTMVATVLLKLGNCALKLNDYPHATAYAQQAMAAARALGNDKMLNSARVILSQATPNAYERERRAEMLEMQERYEADKRARMIELLKRENALKSAEIANRRLQQRMWAGALGVLALGAILVGFLYRKVRQANAALYRKNLELKRQGERDPMTGACNRRHFQEVMRERGADAAMEGGLFLLDVDHFKRINDGHGHAAGDAVLKTLAPLLQEIVGADGMVVRWGGEEFLVFLSAVPAAGLEDVAQRLLEGVAARPVATDAASLPLTISLGFAPFPLRAGTRALPWERALHLVDMALYLAKARGRNRAYGIRAIGHDDPAVLARIERNLEAAWQAGLADVVLVAPDAAEVAGTGVTA